MPQRGRTIMYIDNSNVFKSLHCLGWKIDVYKLFSEMQKAGEIWQTHFFAAVTDPPRYSQTNFYKRLKNDLHWETHIFPLGRKNHKCKSCETSWTSWAEKGVDVALATTLLIHAHNKAFDTAILVSGDKDYLDTVKTVKNLGLRLEIAAFRHSLAPVLECESSIPVILLNDLRSDLELKEKELDDTEEFIPEENAA